MVSIVFGSAAVFGILDKNFQVLALAAAAVVTVFSAINLVMGSSMRARDHFDLARRFVVLEKEIVASLPDAETLKLLTVKRLDIEADEPPVLRVLDCLCHNEEMRAQGYPADQMANIRWWQALLSPLIDVREDLIHA